jgi:hypothetical protein
MRLTNVVPADSMEVAGFEQHTMTCPGCGDVEQRLVFSQRVVSTEAPVKIPVDSPIAALMAARVEMEAPTRMPAPIKMDLTLPVEGSPLAHVPAKARPGRDQERVYARVSTRQERVHARVSTDDGLAPVLMPLKDPRAVADSEGTETAPAPAHNAPPAETPVVRKAWAQATERLQRRTAIAPETTGETVANVPAPAPTKPIRELDDFDRLWESLAQPLPPSAPSTPMAASPAHDEPIVSSLDVSALPTISDEKPHAPVEPARLEASGPDEAPPQQWRPAPQPAASPARPVPERPGTLEVLRHAWTRAAAMLRGKPGASKPDQADAILQVDAGPLKW